MNIIKTNRTGIHLPVIHYFILLIFIFSSCRQTKQPLTINYLAENAPVIIEAWYLGLETGHALADVIFGKVNPSGKLILTFPRNAGQIPCYYNHKPSCFREYVHSDSSPLFPFGLGLSYTFIKYSNLKLSSKEIKSTDSVRKSVQIKNSGVREDDDIVQLYIYDLVSLPTRPAMELKDFARVSLKPGEVRKVEFLLTPEKLEALNINMKRTLQPEKIFHFGGKKFHRLPFGYTHCDKVVKTLSGYKLLSGCMYQRNFSNDS